MERIAFPATHILLVSCIRVFAEPFPCDRVERGTAGMVTVTLSGPHLVRCLSVFWSVRVLGPRFAEPSWFAMISRLYALLAELVDGIDPQSCRGGLPPLIVDAGLKADEPVTA
ncbi:hypothetical protein PV341_29355 [Streptomyces sp. PA03-1a]|nr:hypothetical protein [Streptomyces sp. PA03-1a]